MLLDFGQGFPRILIQPVSLGGRTGRRSSLFQCGGRVIGGHRPKHGQPGKKLAATYDRVAAAQCPTVRRSTNRTMRRSQYSPSSKSPAVSCECTMEPSLSDRYMRGHPKFPWNDAPDPIVPAISSRYRARSVNLVPNNANNPGPGQSNFIQA